MRIVAPRLRGTTLNDAPSRLAVRAEALRSAFDRSFAEPAHFDTTPMADLLAFHAGSQAYALHLSEIAGLFADKKITRLPGRTAALLGIAGFRGAIVPVYDLSALLGSPRRSRRVGWSSRRSRRSPSRSRRSIFISVFRARRSFPRTPATARGGTSAMPCERKMSSDPSYA